MNGSTLDPGYYYYYYYYSMTISRLDCTVTILQGRDLVAKDRNVFGKKTTSDPYVEVWATGQRGKAQQVGKTNIQYKTLNPVWEKENSFSYSFALNDNNTTLSGCQLQLMIWDYDHLSAPDAMGTVTINVPCSHVDNMTEWMTIPASSARNAKGQLLVKMSVTPVWVTALSRGNAWTLPQYSNKIQVGLAWDLVHGRDVDLDVSCVAVNRDGQVCLEDCVYYGRVQNSNESIVHSGDEQAGDLEGDDESITLFLNQIPSRILALYIVLTVATPGMTIADARTTVLSLYGWDRPNDARSKTTLCTFTPATVGQNSTAMFMVRLARQSTNNSWTCQPIQDTHPTARDFGSLIPHIKSYTRDLIPNIVVDPAERVAVLRKGGNIHLREYCKGGVLPEVLTFGLAWDVTNGVNIDLDASIVCLDSDLSVVDTIWFRQLTSKDGSIKHHGDEREGDEEGDDEQIDIQLSMVRRNVEYMVLVINSYSGQELDDVDRASCHLFDSSTQIDMASYAMTNSKWLDGYTALFVACLYRGSKSGDWCLSIMSEAGMGRTVQDNVSQIQRYLCKHRPTPPKDQQEQDIVVKMPPFAPLVPSASEVKLKGPSASNSTLTSPSDEMPKKYVKVNGVTKINPEYKKWKEANS